MSKGARLRAARATRPQFQSADAALRDIRRHRRRPGIEVAVMPGACLHDHDEVDAMKRRTHDGLIEMLGRRRRSGIWWLTFHGSVECTDRMIEMYPPDELTAEQAGLIRQYLDYFEEHGDDAVLVVASCEALVAEVPA